MLEGQIVYLEVDSITPNSYNPNEMPKDLFDSLLEDAKQNGAEALDPILVRPLDSENLYEIIDGESRWNVAKQLGWQRIRATIRKVSVDEAKAINYRKNRERGNLNPFKEAKLFESEIKQGKTYDQIAEKYMISHAQVGVRLSLLNITEEAKQIVTRVTMDRKVSPSHLEVIASIEEPEKQTELAEKIVALDLSVRQTEEEAKKLVEPFKEKVVVPCEFRDYIMELAKVVRLNLPETAECENCKMEKICGEYKQAIFELTHEISS